MAAWCCTASWRSSFTLFAGTLVGATLLTATLILATLILASLNILPFTALIGTANSRRYVLAHLILRYITCY